ncbi:MAG: aminotransferase class V-fold PLP-dependent enzyme [Acidobacteria bacterium]|nr:aminotransferase class V-fold PLP-dependent enzyme [Acidobacteriota bacterium]MCI0621416.1 aminotransferase class V-fold PLP-dependent enzyme [Acidobacteriota bacterium]MCI0724434.1 aminotransferase class V-fold PLP-dependent enzyme [Acidobacteriota bacterium]
MTQSGSNKLLAKLSRREVFQAGGWATAWSLLGSSPAVAKADGQNLYTRIGVRPFINLTATYTINGGALSRPEVKQAMEEASHYPVNLDELMEKVGERLAELLGCEWGIVTAGCAAALVHATAACVAGSDPEKMLQLPNLQGLKDQVIMPKQSRNVYDHAIRVPGVRIVEVGSREEFHAALSERTAMIAVLGTAEAKGSIRLEEIAEAGRKAAVPVLVDAAAELPVVPNPYLSRGADLVGYSGGKFLRGPQCAGLLLGRKDLVRAAWLNSSPHHALGRAMKVGKEEIMGMLTAMEVWRNKYDLQAEYQKWESWYGHISKVITQVPGVQTQVKPPAGASPFPVMEVAWDPQQVGLTAEEVGHQLREGEPRIFSHAEGPGHSFIIRPVAMKEGEYRMVAERLQEVLRRAPKGKPPMTLRAPAVDVVGRWEVSIEFTGGAARHQLHLGTNANEITGTHVARIAKGELSGTIDGEKVSLRSSLPYEGTRLTYEFSGMAQASEMSGEVSVGEYGRARWSAKRLRAAEA